MSNSTRAASELIFFFGKYINRSEYEQMWCVFKLLLCLSHGQASVERGFSVNSNLLVENMHEDSLTAQKSVHDHMKSLKLEAFDVKVILMRLNKNLFQINAVNGKQK